MAYQTPQNLDLYPIVERKKRQVHRCKILNTSWILGNKEPFAILQNLCEGDLYV